MVRLKLWGSEEYLEQHNIDMGHLDHCIDSMRQSFMCSADISAINYQWDEAEQYSKGQLTTMHTCRDFDAIKGWALEHTLETWDSRTHVPDPLKGGI